jgi:hypothetical protein
MAGMVPRCTGYLQWNEFRGFSGVKKPLREGLAFQRVAVAVWAVSSLIDVLPWFDRSI